MWNWMEAKKIKGLLSWFWGKPWAWSKKNCDSKNLGCKQSVGLYTLYSLKTTSNVTTQIMDKAEMPEDGANGHIEHGQAISTQKIQGIIKDCTPISGSHSVFPAEMHHVSV